MRRICVLTAFILTIAFSTEQALSATPTPQEIGAFWNTVFNGPAPFGVPPLNAIRFNQRTVSNCTVWDVRFDSYKDPVTNLPVRLGGVFAVPNNVVPPGPGGTFPGLVVTHSVGVMPPAGPAPDDVQGMSTWFAQKGFAALAFYMRGWGTSPMSVTADLFTDFLATENGQPLNNRWTGMAVDSYQAGEFLAAQPEVWDPAKLTYAGHSGGGYAVLAGGVFSSRFKVICGSAPAGAWPDAGQWLDFVWGNGGFLSILTWINNQPDPTFARSLVERTLTFISMHHAINNPFLIAHNPSWRIDNTAIFLYGGQADTAIPAWDVATNFQLVDPSTPSLKALHWSPTSGHGGPESWSRTQAWIAGHYPGTTATAPVAALAVTSINGATVSFSATGTQAWEYDWNYGNGSMTVNNDNVVSWEFDFGDGLTMNWGPNVSHTYALAGNYLVTLTVTDGAGSRDDVSVPVVVAQGSGSNPQLQVVAENPEVVPEGGSNSFLVRLTQNPGGSIVVAVERTAGDADLSVSSGANLVFSQGNWSVFQTAVLAARSDGDHASDSAVLSVSAAGMTTVNVNAMERDSDADFMLQVGNAITAPRTATSVPIMLANLDAAPLASFSISLSFDAAVLTGPVAVAGPDLPGPAWWEFSASIPNPGLQVVDANEFVQPTNPVINGLIAVDSFTIPAQAEPGVYPITITSATANGLTVTNIEDGYIVVAASGDMNCDGATDVLDVPYFVTVLISPSTFSGCHLDIADMNADGKLDGNDIAGFVAVLL